MKRPGNEARLVQGPGNEARLVQRPGNEARLMKRPGNEARLFLYMDVLYTLCVTLISGLQAIISAVAEKIDEVGKAVLPLEMQCACDLVSSLPACSQATPFAERGTRPFLSAKGTACETISLPKFFFVVVTDEQD